MKLIHCADLHLDSSFSARFSREQAKERNIELLKNFERMITYGNSIDVTGILIAGDCFDSNLVSSLVKNSVMELIRSNPNISFFYLEGNHDKGSFVKKQEKSPENLYLFDENWKSYVIGKLAITGAELSGENGGFLGETLQLKQEYTNIVMLHGMAAEYQSATGEYILPLSSFRKKGIDYMALGHIHAYRKERLDSRGIYCYSGCLEGRGFDECGEKGFVLLEISEDTGEIETSFVPFARRRMYQKNVIIDGCLSTLEISLKVEEELNGLGAEQQDCVSIHLVGCLELSCEKNLLYLQREYEERFYYFEIVDETSYTVDYSEFMLEETLRGEFVRVVQKEELSEMEKAEIIRCGILALSGEEISR